MNNKRWMASLLCAALTVYSLAPAQGAFALEISSYESDEEEDDSANTVDVSKQEPDAYVSVAIDSMEDFLEVAQNCHYDSWSVDKYIVLNVDLDFSETEFTPIESFGGLFDGNGHALTGITLSDYVSETGVFGTIQNTGVVADLTVQITISPTGNQSTLGGIAGYNYGTISGCSTEVDIEAKMEVGGIVGRNGQNGVIISCSTLGSVIGSSSTGGIAGYNEGTITSCVNGAKVNTVYQDTTASLDDLTDTLDSILQSGSLINSDSSEDDSDTGGIAGFSSGVITSCSNTAVVGYEHVGYNVGGIVGRSSGFLSGNINMAAVYGRKDVGGIAGQLQPYLMLSFTDNETLSELADQFDELFNLVDETLSDVDLYSSLTSNHLTNIGGLAEIAEEAVRDIASEGADLYDSAAAKINAATSALQDSFSSLSSMSSSMSSYMDDIGDSMDDLGSSISSYVSDLKLSDEEKETISALIATLEEGYEAVVSGTKKLSNLLSGPTISDDEQTRDAILEALEEIAGGYQTMLEALEGMLDVLESSESIDEDDEALQRLRYRIESAIEEIEEILSQIEDDSSSLNALDLEDGTDEFLSDLEDGELTFSDLSELTAELEEIQLKLDTEFPDGALLDLTSEIVVEALRQKLADAGMSEDEIEEYIESLASYQEQRDAIQEAIDELELILQETATDEEAIAQWVESFAVDDLLGTIQDGTSSLVDSLEDMGSLIKAYVADAADISELSDSISDAMDTLTDDHGIFSDLTAAMDSLASMDLQISGISDSMRNNSSTLYESISQLTEEMEALSDSVSDMGDEGVDGLREIFSQFDLITETMIDAAEDALNDDDDDGGLQDISDEDVENTYRGRATSCVNYGEVNADTNVGGIVGMVGVEYSLDPETDIQQSGSSSLNYIFQAKCIVDSCTNRGKVTTRSNYTGGIAGHMEMGMVSGCENYGDIVGGGNYVGGIVGYCPSLIKYSTAKCDISGGKYVGGIAGYGTTLTGNIAMVNVTEYEQYAGAIAGRVSDIDSEDISGNYYYSDADLWGIDAVSYEGIAEGISYEELTALEGLPNDFFSLLLTFTSDDVVLATIACNFGDAVSEEDIPDIPEKEGFYGHWSREDFGSITSDEVITASYTRLTTLLTSVQTREDGLSLIEVDGSFEEGSSLILTSMRAQDGETERWMVSIPDDGAKTHQIRFLPPAGAVGISVYVIQNGVKTKVETTSFGSYLLFEAQGLDVAFCIESAFSSDSGMLRIVLIIVGAAILFLIIFLMIRSQSKKKKKALATRKAREDAWLDEDEEEDI